MSHTTSIKTVAIKSITAVRAAVEELNRKGIRCELRENSVPRMYYPNQLQMHKGRKNEIADAVIHLPGSRYDVALLKQEDGSYECVFDDWQKEVAKVLGQPFKGTTEHWSGNRPDTEQTLHSVGKFLQEYSVCAAVEAATMAGYSVLGHSTDANGCVQLQISVD